MPKRRTVLKSLVAGMAAAVGSRGIAGVSALGPTLAAAPDAKRLKILVLGGRRYLGPAFVRAALARGHEVTLFNRGKTQNWLFPGLTHIKGNRFPEKDEGLSGLAKGEWDAVVDLCAQYPRIVDATTKLLAGRTDFYALVSSISAYANYKIPGMDETGVLRALNKPFEELPDLIENDFATYGARKAACESLVEAVFDGRSVILRSPTICGGDNNDGTGAYWAARMMSGEPVLVPGDGSDPVQLIDVRDLAEFLLLSVEKRLTGPYNVIGPAAPLTSRAYIETCMKVAGGGKPVWKGDFPRAMYNVPLIPPTEVVPGFATIRSDKAKAAGLRFTPLEETILSNLVDHRARRGDAYDFGAAGTGLTKAREAELMADIKVA